MPAFGGEVVNGQILLDVHVRLPVRPSDPDSIDLGGAEMEPMTFQGLLDTGATRTMVSQNVIDALDARPCGVDAFVPATGEPEPTAAYRVDLAIPIVAGVSLPADDADAPNYEIYASGLRNLTVLALPRAFDNFDVLLGMDLILQFHITMWRGLYILGN